MKKPGAIEFLYAPINGWLVLLAQGWELPFIVKEMPYPHGAYSILLRRPA